MSVQEKLFVVATFVIAAASGMAQSPTPSVTEAPPASASPATPSNSAAPVVSLSGRWRFNVDKSEDAREKMKEARAARGGDEGGGGGRWGGGGGGGWGGHGGGGGRGGYGGGGMGGRRRPSGDGDGGQAPERRPNMSRFFEPAKEILITQTANEITILDKDGPIRVLHPDGHKYKTDNGDSDIKTHWDKEKLVVDTEPARGAKLSEAYVVSTDGKELTEDVQMDGRFGKVTVRRVYDALPAE